MKKVISTIKNPLVNPKQKTRPRRKTILSELEDRTFKNITFRQTLDFQDTIKSTSLHIIHTPKEEGNKG